MSEQPITVVVVCDDLERPAWALRAGHLITMTEFVADAHTMIVWVEQTQPEPEIIDHWTNVEQADQSQASAGEDPNQ